MNSEELAATLGEHLKHRAGDSGGCVVTTHGPGEGQEPCPPYRLGAEVRRLTDQLAERDAAITRAKGHVASALSMSNDVLAEQHLDAAVVALDGVGQPEARCWACGHEDRVHGDAVGCNFYGGNDYECECELIQSEIAAIRERAGQPEVQPYWLRRICDECGLAAGAHYETCSQAVGQ